MNTKTRGRPTGTHNYVAVTMKSLKNILGDGDMVEIRPKFALKHNIPSRPIRASELVRITPSATESVVKVETVT